MRIVGDKNKSYAPIILFVYSRPDHTLKTLNALAENELAKESELFIFCDGPKNDKAKEKNDIVKEVIKNEEQKNRFKKTTVFVSETNKGLATSIISGVSKIIDEYGCCIVLEDDHITSPHFLEYMNLCLDKYESNKKIWSISGFTYPLKSVLKDEDPVYLSYRACSHGWATWKDRWQDIDWQVKDFSELKASLRKRHLFNRGGNDLFRMLKHQMKGERDSWAIRFCYAQSKRDMLTVYPKYSFIKNIGFDGSGTHCEAVAKEKADAFRSDFTVSTIPEVKLKKNVVKEFKVQYKIGFIEAVRWLVNKISK